MDAASATTAGSLALQNQQLSLQANPLADTKANGAIAAPGGPAEKAAQEFESFFLSQMLSPMFQGLGNDPLFGGGPGEEIFQSLMIQEYATVLSKNGGVGLSESVTREILRLQEANQ